LGLPLKEGQTAQVILTKKNKQNSIVWKRIIREILILLLQF
jgi:hypothetical protein